MAESSHSTLGGRSHAPELPLPYFEAWRGDGVPTEARLLLVSPLFPPDTSVGALRWQKFARYFAERGWKLDVLAYDPDGADGIDPARLEQLPTGTRAYGVGAPKLAVDRLERQVRRLLEPLRPGGRDGGGSEKYDVGGAGADENPGERGRWLTREESERSARSPRGVYRAYRAWRHRRQAEAWSEAALATGRSLALTVEYRAVVSSGPPHRAHLAARAVAREIGRPLVLDLRDPWSLLEAWPEDFASPSRFRHAERNEAACVADASLVVANTEPHREALARRYPEAADRIVTVLNGYDPEDAVEPSSPPDRFRVVYTGSIYGSRDPRPFLSAAGRVVGELEASPEEFSIEFLGRCRSFRHASVVAMAESAGLADHFEAPGVLPRREALDRAARASVLLNLPQDAGLCVPAKVYEYLQMDGWILALEPEGTATERLLRGTRADVVAPDDVDGIAQVLRRRFRQFSAGERPSGDEPDAALSRAAQAARLLDAMGRRLG